MATIRDLTNRNAILKVDPTSFAMHVCLKKTDGIVLYENAKSYFAIPFDWFESVDFAANSFMWSMWVGELTVRAIRIRAIQLTTGFSTTAGAAGRHEYKLIRYFGVPMTAGNALVPVPLNDQTAYQVVDARQTAGAAVLTATGAIVESAYIESIKAIARNIGNGELDIDEKNFFDRPIELSPYSGLAIQNVVAASTIIGSLLSGYVIYEEVPK